jgi:hypothetical protein
MLTSVPSTAVVLLLTGWIVVPEVRFAPTAASFRLKAEATHAGLVWLPALAGRLPQARKMNSSIVDHARTT